MRYYGFFAPGCRKRLAALRHQLQNAFPDCDESGDAEQGQELAASALAPILRCPSCGQGEAIGAEGHSEHDILVTLQHTQELSALRVPHAYQLVAAAFPSR